MEEEYQEYYESYYFDTEDKSHDPVTTKDLGGNPLPSPGHGRPRFNTNPFSTPPAQLAIIIRKNDQPAIAESVHYEKVPSHISTITTRSASLIARLQKETKNFCLSAEQLICFAERLGGTEKLGSNYGYADILHRDSVYDSEFKLGGAIW
jgi:hypothetical protein